MAVAAKRTTAGARRLVTRVMGEFYIKDRSATTRSAALAAALRQSAFRLLRRRQAVGWTRDPGVKRRQQQEADERVHDQTAHDHDRERPLRIRPDVVGEGRRRSPRVATSMVIMM